MIKLFLGIFTSFIRFIKIFLPCVSDPELADRPGRSTARSTAPRAGRPSGRPTCIALCTSGSPVGRSTDRSTLPESSALCIWAVDRAVDRTRELCSLELGGRPGGRPRAPTVGNPTVGGRPAGRPQACQAVRNSLTASFLFGLYKPHFFGILAKIFRANFSPFSGFKNKFLKEF